MDKNPLLTHSEFTLPFDPSSPRSVSLSLFLSFHVIRSTRVPDVEHFHTKQTTKTTMTDWHVTKTRLELAHTLMVTLIHSFSFVIMAIEYIIGLVLTNHAVMIPPEVI